MNIDWKKLNNFILKLEDKNNNLSTSKIRFNPNLIEELNSIEFLKVFPTIKEKYYAIKNKLTERPKCYCGNALNVINDKRIYPQFCSVKCSANSDSTRNKFKKTNIEKYGCENPNQNKEVRNKIEKTNTERYGCKSPSQNLKIQEKIKTTNLEKYGHIAPSQNEEVKNKTKVTNLQRYGVEWTQQNKEIKQKSINTNLEKYGVKYSSQNEEISNKIKNSNIDLHIKNNLPEILNQIKEVYNVIPHEWQINEYMNSNKEYNFVHLNCGLIFKAKFKNAGPRCRKCHIFWNSSKIERKVQDYLIDLLGNDILQFSDRKLIKPYELDIIINNKLAVEINGTYWHREGSKAIPLLEKTKVSSIPILHFWDFELENKFDICMSIILSKLNKIENKIFARKCKYNKVSSKDAREFFDKYHLQGSSNSSMNYGLYYDDELMQCISIGKSRFNKNYDYEIHRMATKLNTQVVGGVSKLFSRVKEDLAGLSITTYADLRISTGEIYKNLGFEELPNSAPNYMWVKGEERLPRYKTQKHKLHKRFENFDPNLTETQNMELNGYHKIKDCGNKVFKIQL